MKEKNIEGDETLQGGNKQVLFSGKESNEAKDVSGEESINLLRYLMILYIHKWKFLLILVCVMAAAVVYSYYQPVYYKSSHEIFYNESIKQFVVESDVPVIKSDFDKSFWLSSMNSGEAARLTLENSGLPYTADIIDRMISVDFKDKRDDAPIFVVTVTSKNAQIIPVLFNSFLKALNQLLEKNQASNSEKLVVYLSGQLEDNNKKLADIDRKILVTGAGDYNGSDYKKLAADLAGFRNDLVNTGINLASARASKEKTELELKNLDGTIVNESAFSEPLKVQLMNLQVDLARALTKNKEDHPVIQGIRENIAYLNTMLRDSIQQTLEIKSLVQNPLKAQLVSKLMELQINEISLESREFSLRKVIAEFEQKMLPDTTDENGRQLLQNRELVNMTINLLNSKLIEAQSAAQGNLSRFVMIDEPEVPLMPAGKGRLFILMLGLLVGLLLAGGGIFILDMLDNRLMLVDDYYRFFNLPVLGSLQHRNQADEYMVVPGNKESYHRLHEFGEILVNLNHIIRAKGSKLFAVCSPLRMEGKSMTSLRLASSLADKGRNVLLVDMDFFAPKLSGKLSKKGKPGLINYVNSECTFDKIIQSTSNPNLSFVSTGSEEPLPMFSYDHPAFVGFTSLVKNKFDIVIFDTPAALYIPDTINLTEHMDGIIVIVRLMHTSRKSIERFIRMIGPNMSKFTGVIINDLQITRMNRYSQYYNYENEKGYGEGRDKSA